MGTTRNRTGWLVGGLGAAALLVSVRCANVDGGLGTACVRNEDCLSGVCAGAMCVAQSMLLRTLPTTDAAAGVDAGQDAAIDAPPDVATVADTGALADTGVDSDAPITDGPATDGDTGVPDGAATTDAAHDGATSTDSGAPKDSGTPKDSSAHRKG